MKSIKPLSLGLLHRPYRIGDENRFVVAALGFFKLGETNERFLIDNLQWPQVAKALAPGQMLDEVMPKPVGEVLLNGTAHAPEGKPVAAMAVSLKVGTLEKTLRVVGDRTWSYGLLPFYRISKPKPFTSMPLDYAHAFGGKKLPANPVGIGYSGNPFAAFVGSNQGVLPNIENPAQPARLHWRRYDPAGFGPINISWTPRMTLLRAMQRPDVRKLTAQSPLPGLSANVDRTLFQLAQPDQRLPGFFSGGEPYRLTGMHPDKAAIEGRLPDLTARAFIQRTSQSGEVADEVPMHCDTVWFFPELLLGVMIWHGEIAITDSLGLDVSTVLVAYERIGSPRPVDHYGRAIARRNDPATAGHDVFNESQLAADYTPVEQARRQATQHMEQAASSAKQQAVLDEQMADFWAKSGLKPPADFVPPKVPAPPFAMPAPQQVKDKDFDVGALLDAAKAYTAQAQKDAEQQQKEAGKKLAALPPVPPPTVREQQQKVLARASVTASDLQGQAVLSPEWRSLLDAAASAPPFPEGGPGGISAPVDKAMAVDTSSKSPLTPLRGRGELEATIAQLPAQQRKARLMSPEGEKDAAKLDPVVAAWLGQQVALWHAGGAFLAGRDLAGAKVAGMDFSGADLREVMFDYADLSGAKFVGANLQNAVLTGAVLDGADFSGANLQGANLNLSRGRSICFAGANMSRAQSDNAHWLAADLSRAKLAGWRASSIDLSGASLDDASLVGAVLPSANAPDSQWRRANLDKTVLLRSTLRGADFSGAVLNRATLIESQLAGSDWSRASFTAVVAGGEKTDWRGAILRGASGERSNWQGTSMTGADLSGARLNACDFSRCDLSEATLAGGVFGSCVFMAAKLNRAQAAGADFYQALAQKADFSDADLSGASLVQANVAEALFVRTLLTGVVIEPTRRIAQ
ncbi:DUF2169 family type VI secretion system accessory protein [Andreprevotia chitinilytica]|uniref:DUF2169 family type VI secretion system accessory protein n=1 Tax=Andreprevotia chitinilytica TaxID=396808 RepID=UPI00068D6FCF|nr:DUF2169 domain-containing protein [Andreprevotia chitinilytica]